MPPPTVTDRDLADLVERIQRLYGDGCFACGTANPAGLHLTPVAIRDGWVTASFVPTADHVGAPPSIHGGIAATAIDEIMVWAAIVFEDVMTVTATLDLRYRSPVRTGAGVVAAGRIEGRSGRRLRMRAVLEVDGRNAVEGSGLYVVSAPVSGRLHPPGAP